MHGYYIASIALWGQRSTCWGDPKPLIYQKYLFPGKVTRVLVFEKDNQK